jgi:hypothetical protein
MSRITGIEVLAFMQPVTIELCQLIFPAQLPFGEHVFFECMVCFDHYHWCGSFKSHTAFYTDDSVTHMHISSYPVRAGNGL